MTAIVFTSVGSRKYHFDQSCKAFHSAQLLSDLDCGCDTYCTHRMPRMHALQADERHPCRHRRQAALPRLRTRSTCGRLPESEDFAHEPTVGTSLFGLAEQVCQRCTEWGVWYGTVTEMRPVHIPWPCTSAIVLGLVPRPTAAVR
jgi:hypothetical protein